MPQPHPSGEPQGRAVRVRGDAASRPRSGWDLFQTGTWSGRTAGASVGPGLRGGLAHQAAGMEVLGVHCACPLVSGSKLLGGKGDRNVRQCGIQLCLHLRQMKAAVSFVCLVLELESVGASASACRPSHGAGAGLHSSRSESGLRTADSFLPPGPGV